MPGHRVVVTGAAGFIGSHTAEALVRRGDDVLGLDCFDPFYDRSFKEANLEEVRATASGAPGSFGFVEADIADVDGLRRAVAPFKPTAFVHLAAKAGVRPSIEDPTGYARANVTGTTNVLRIGHELGCDRMTCASSSSVYGDSSPVPFSEEHAPDEPISPYAATKRACELIGYTHHHLTKQPVAMLRFFTVYGPRQRPDLAISLFLGKVGRGETINMFGDGTTSRDYTFIDDIVSGVIASLDRIPEYGYRVWNLGGSSPTTLADMIRLVGETVGRDPVVERKPMQPGDVQRTWADVTRSGRELGYAPTTPLEQGLPKQWAWLRERDPSLAASSS